MPKEKLEGLSVVIFTGGLFEIALSIANFAGVWGRVVRRCPLKKHNLPCSRKATAYLCNHFGAPRKGLAQRALVAGACLTPAS